MNATIDRRRIYIFIAITYGFSVVLALVIYLNGGIFLKYPFGLTPLAIALMSLLMFAPTIANIATRLITREGWSNMLLWPKFRHGWPYYLAGWTLPALATIVGGVIYYLLFPAQFDPSRTYATETLGLVSIMANAGPATFLIVQTLYVLVGSLTGLPLMFGEEFGWRGYLLPKLMPLGARQAVLLVGVIWGIWHWPYILMGYEYGFNSWGAPVVGPLLFVVICCFLSTIFAWLTLRSGSVWPATIAHGVFNGGAALMLYFIVGESENLIGPTPVGLIGALGYIVLAVLIFFSHRALAPMAGPRPAAPRPVEAAAHGAAD